MKARKFELFMCCLGNGVTVCNSAVREDNDLKIIAHISNAGNIKLRVDKDYIPVDDMNIIKKTAKEMKREYMENFYKQSQMRQYEQMFDRLIDVDCKKLWAVTKRKDIGVAGYKFLIEGFKAFIGKSVKVYASRTKVNIIMNDTDVIGIMPIHLEH